MDPLTSNGEQGTVFGGDAYNPHAQQLYRPTEGHDTGQASSSVILGFDMNVNSNADEVLTGIGAAHVDEILAGVTNALFHVTVDLRPETFTSDPEVDMIRSMPILPRPNPVQALLRAFTETDLSQFRGYTGMWPPPALDVRAMMYQDRSQFMFRRNVSLASLADATAGFLTPRLLRTPPPSPILQHDYDLILVEMGRRLLEEEDTASLSRTSSYDMLAEWDLNNATAEWDLTNAMAEWDLNNTTVEWNLNDVLVEWDLNPM